jgi:hypothetical protein
MNAVEATVRLRPAAPLLWLMSSSRQVQEGSERKRCSSHCRASSPAAEAPAPAAPDTMLAWAMPAEASA